MEFKHNDGGRAAAGYKGSTGDCVTRAIAIATGKPYQEVYDAINELAKDERVGKRKRPISKARDGVFKQTYRKYLEAVGWHWRPCMSIGSGCRVHLADGELPMGTLIVRVSKHLTCVIDGVIHDTHDPQREVHTVTAEGVTVTKRCVYGYFTKEAPRLTTLEGALNKTFGLRKRSTRTAVAGNGALTLACHSRTYDTL